MNWVFLSFFLLSFLTSYTRAQQEYSANSVLNCNNTDDTKPSSDILYTCNGQNSSCRAYLIFKSEPPFNSVPTISALMSSNPSKLARINNVTRLTVFTTGKEVIVPVNCSCSGQYYQANTTFYIPNDHETYFIIANNTFQGLSTCDSLKRSNSHGEFKLLSGFELFVPLRCACPTRNQINEGTEYLLTYSVTWGDQIRDLGERFNVSSKSIVSANGFSEENPTLFPFTTILIPLPTQPLSSQTLNRNQILEISPPPNSEIRKTTSKRKTYVNLGIAALISLLVLAAILFIIFLSFTKRREDEKKSVLPVDLLVEIASFEKVLRVFNFKELNKGTKNFSPKSRIKGNVYRGVLGGEILAIKRTSIDVSKEANMLNKINHFNLIKLRGVCEDRGIFYLVFEYMKNGSLKEWLQKRSFTKTESWGQRIQIALDIANGLYYLHSFTKPAYVHKDIKSSNVLLDGNLRAKIANFSLARTIVTCSSDSRVVGTRGYIAPEYIDTGYVTPKIDVYAFGVVMLEIITGKEAVIVEDGREVLLSEEIAAIFYGGNGETEIGCFICRGLEENGGMEHAIRMVKLSLACLRKDPASRPSMGEVASILSKIEVDIQKSATQED